MGCENVALGRYEEGIGTFQGQASVVTGRGARAITDYVEWGCTNFDKADKLGL